MPESRPEPEAWELRYDAWLPGKQPLREALCTLGNGYFATRGAAEEASAGGPHYPGTYLASGYNRLESEVAGRIVENEDLVNWPNWLCLSFRIADGPWFSLDDVDLLDFRQTLDLREGLLERRLRFRHPDRPQHETRLISRRLVHMDDPHLAVIQWELTPLNWSNTIEIRSALDGTVRNQGVARYRDLESRHLEIVDIGRIGEDGICLTVETNRSGIRMTQAARTLVFCEGEPAPLERTCPDHDAVAEQRLFVECRREKPLRIEKIVAIHTSRDRAISEPGLAARQAVRRAGSFEDLRASHVLAWKALWNRADIGLDDCDIRSQRILRLHIFHLLQTASPHTIELDAGVGARGLHGEAYRGHIFWDELFIFPFLNLRLPELTRALLLYRYRRLPKARQLAAKAGYQGAMYPWQSGSNGREESQELHLNPRSRRWIPDHTHRQRHVNASIAYNVWQYYQSTRDVEFLAWHGAEMLLEIARFWASAADYNGERERYEIHGVVGPDEFHTHDPSRDEPGLANNAYTNVMAAWVLRCARQVLDLLTEGRRAELIEKLRLSDEEFLRWDDVGCKMFIPFHDDGIISQFEGYEQLEEFDWKDYRNRYKNIERLDRILEAENDTVNRYKASKQADVLMLFYLFSSEELRDLFEHLGYEFPDDLIPRNIDYYLARTSDGSTLSRVVHSWVLARSDRERSWQVFRRALESDVADVQGGTTPEGIHLGAMAGTVDLIQRCYTGIEMRDEILWLNPRLPQELREVRLRLHYGGHWLRICVTDEILQIVFEHGGTGSAKVGFLDQVYTFRQGDTREFALKGSVDEKP